MHSFDLPPPPLRHRASAALLGAAARIPRAHSTSALLCAVAALCCLSTVNMKPFRVKTTYLLYATTFLGYVAGKTLFGALAPLPKAKAAKKQ